MNLFKWFRKRPKEITPPRWVEVTTYDFREAIKLIHIWSTAGYIPGDITAIYDPPRYHLGERRANEPGPLTVEEFERGIEPWRKKYFVITFNYIGRCGFTENYHKKTSPNHMSLDIWIESPQGARVWDRNITHNLTPMWREAGCYDALYNSDGKRCEEIFHPIVASMSAMFSDRRRFEKLNPPNGWGSYEGALDFLVSFVDAMGKHPTYIIRVSK